MGIASLDSALSGLRIAQQQINTISNNISNVSTPGFTRKILPQSTQVINGVGVGVRPDIVIRNVDSTLQRDLWTQVSAVGSRTVRQTYLQRIEQFHGPPDAELSVASAISRLKDAFSVLNDNPTDNFLLSSTINQAQDTARKINDLAKFINTMRNDAQSEMTQVVNRINGLLQQISEVNSQIRTNLNVGLTTAALADQRDIAIQELAGLIDISYFSRGDGVLVVQTNEGVELASNRAEQLYFNPSPLSATSYYPLNVASVFVGNPETNPAAIDITPRDPGGKLGGLITLRDETFPKQTAQIDELAHKLALRFEAQGLRLFTNASGIVPLDTPPDLTSDPQVPVTYVGFASQIRVNSAILADNTLLQRGTYGDTNIAPGSNEVIRRVLEFAFTDTNFQLAEGGIDLTAAALIPLPANPTLHEFLGISPKNQLKGFRDLASFNSIADFIAATDGGIDALQDSFRLVFEEPNAPLGPVAIDISLSTIVPGPGNAAQELIDAINTAILALPAPDQAALTDMNVGFGISPNGELAITAAADITIIGVDDGSLVPPLANFMGTNNLELLGFKAGTYEAEQPYFDIQIGNNDPVRIEILSNETPADLLAKLQAVPGLAVQDFTTSADGFLRLRPGNDYDNPDFGGDLKIFSGNFLTSGAAANDPLVIGPGTIPDGINLVSALFGTFSAGPPVQDLSPISNIDYASLVQAGSTATVAFRTQFLGPGIRTGTEVIGARNLTDYGQKMVNEHAQELLSVSNSLRDEDTLRGLLETELLNRSGVNLDEELGRLIVVQTAYAAAARVIAAIDEAFQELLNAVR